MFKSYITWLWQQHVKIILSAKKHVKEREMHSTLFIPLQNTFIYLKFYLTATEHVYIFSVSLQVILHKIIFFEYNGLVYSTICNTYLQLTR